MSFSTLLTKFFSLILVAGVAVATGLSVGKIYNNMNTPPAARSEVVADLKLSKAELEKLHGRSQSAVVTDFDGVELWQIAEYNLMQQEYFKRDIER